MPNARAARAAYSAAVLVPIITNSAGVTPVTSPKRTPFPPRDLLKYSLAIVIEVTPAI